MPPKEDKLTRIAILNGDRCKPKKCRHECRKSCPVVRLGKLCIEVTPTAKIAFISEELCIGCGICVKKCPYEAISIINLPKDLENNTTHRYGPNSFKLHRLPMPRPGQVLGLVGTNGIGKSTALKVLGGRLKPNLGNYENPPEWAQIITHFRGSELQSYFRRILEQNLKAIMKVQYVDNIPKAPAFAGATVASILSMKNERGVMDQVVNELDLSHLLERNLDKLSGGELQRFAIATVVVQTADVYMFDEPSSYLDVKQRLQASRTIRSLVVAADGAAGAGTGAHGGEANASSASGDGTQRFVLVVEHDLAVLDYLSDYICCLYGTPAAYGVVTMPFSVREGINIFLAGFVPTENLRFRDEALTFKLAATADELGADSTAQYVYPSMTRTMRQAASEGASTSHAAAAAADSEGGRTFILHIDGGTFTDSEIIVMLGENGTGKSTFIKMLCGILKSDEQEKAEKEGDAERAIALGTPQLNISYKPQLIAPKFPGTVRELLHKRCREFYVHPQFITDVMRPLHMDAIIDNEVQQLSGGELQRVAIVLCLGKHADVYLIDEPSAYLDSEQRISASKVIKRFIMHAKKTAFVVEHDFIMATYLADRVIVYDGVPGVEAHANAPMSLLDGMNMFLRQLEITFRRDPTNYRPRINKMESVLDREQKASGAYFFLDEQ